MVNLWPSRLTMMEWAWPLQQNQSQPVLRICSIWAVLKPGSWAKKGRPQTEPMLPKSAPAARHAVAGAVAGLDGVGGEDGEMQVLLAHLGAPVEAVGGEQDALLCLDGYGALGTGALHADDAAGLVLDELLGNGLIQDLLLDPLLPDAGLDPTCTSSAGQASRVRRS